jgi:tyrosyl-tRNA synthetase
LPLEEIDKMDAWEGSQLNTAKEILAFELTKLVHGEEEATKAQETARAVFSGAGSHENMPTTTLTVDDLIDGKIGVLDMMVKAGLVTSKGEGRRLVVQGGVSINDVKITDPAYSLTADDFKNEIILKKGKKVYNKYILN